MDKDTSDAVKLVGTAPKELSSKELEKRQADLLAKLKSITPEQLASFKGASAARNISGVPKELWEKTIWEK
jgi:hypothetical protein